VSVSLTALCWRLQMSPTAKAVLISLADNANDQGECWPSIPTIAERTCLANRSVQRAITALEAAGHLIADRRNGRHTRYTVVPNPRHTVVPDRESRVTERPEPTTERREPTTRSYLPTSESPSNRKEPSRTIRATVKKARASAVARPDEVQEQTWVDWLELRKAKHAPVTQTVLASARSEAEKAGLSLERFLVIWCARGSQGLEAAWLKPNERAYPHGSVINKGPSVAANFRGKDYAGTAINDLPDHLRPTGTDG
jgi:hypothetical protein